MELATLIFSCLSVAINVFLFILLKTEGQALRKWNTEQAAVITKGFEQIIEVCVQQIWRDKLETLQEENRKENEQLRATVKTLMQEVKEISDKIRAIK
jgi:hypothetical protein